MNILITAIGSFSADCVVQSLTRAGHRVIGCDIYPSEWHPVSKDCYKVYQVPFATEEDKYIEALLQICSAEHIDMLFPLTDLEIDVLNRHRVSFAMHNVHLCIQSEYCLSIARNKHEQAKFFKGSIVNVPNTILVTDDISSMTFPAIAKPYDGRSSEGLHRLMSREDLSIIRNREKYIIQKQLSGSVYTVDYVRDTCGNDFSVPREELLRTKNGAGTTVRITPSEKLRDMASFVGSRLYVVGCINMEFIDCDGKFYLIDINPRFSAGVAFSNCIGYDMVKNHLNAFLNLCIDSPVAFREQIIAKRYKEEVICVK